MPVQQASRETSCPATEFKNTLRLLEIRMGKQVIQAGIFIKGLRVLLYAETVIKRS